MAMVKKAQQLAELKPKPLEVTLNQAMDTNLLILIPEVDRKCLTQKQ